LQDNGFITEDSLLFKKQKSQKLLGDLIKSWAWNFSKQTSFFSLLNKATLLIRLNIHF